MTGFYMNRNAGLKWVIFQPTFPQFCESAVNFIHVLCLYLRFILYFKANSVWTKIIFSNITYEEPQFLDGMFDDGQTLDQHFFFLPNNVRLHTASITNVSNII